MAWNPTQYLKFGAHRLRPAVDLLNVATAALSSPIKVEHILDLGCGPGNLCPMLCRAFPVAEVDGLDNSPEMIEKAVIDNSVGLYGGRLSFRIGSIEEEVEKSKKKYDVVFSNASLHWCENHATLFPKLVKTLLKPKDSVLAIQMPDTREQPTHTFMEVAASNCNLMHIYEKVRIPRLKESMESYYSIMSAECTSVTMWRTEYLVQLEVEEGFHDDEVLHPIVEFMQGAGLRPVLSALRQSGAPDDHDRFLREYNKYMKELYPVWAPLRPGEKHTVVVPYKRLFMACGM